MVMVPSQWKALVVPLVLACVLSLGLQSPVSVLAGQNKVDVCHREGNGAYHLISIAEPAYPTHVAHGDGRVGESVSAWPGFVFDADCNLIEVVTCPCNFSASNFLAIGGDPEIAACEIASPTQASLHNPAVVTFDVNDTFCSIESLESFESFDVSASEAEACVLDIQTTAGALELSECDMAP